MNKDIKFGAAVQIKEGIKAAETLPSAEKIGNLAEAVAVKKPVPFDRFIHQS